MSIQHRRGAYSDFDKNKLLEGEWAVVTSGDPSSERGRGVYMGFGSGEAERMATFDDIIENIDQAVADEVIADVVQKIQAGTLHVDVDVEGMLIAQDPPATPPTDVCVKELHNKETTDTIYPVTKASAVHMDGTQTTAQEQIAGNTSAIENILNSLTSLPDLAIDTSNPNRTTLVAKFPSGLMVCAIKVKQTFAISSEWGTGMYYGSTAINFGNWPVAFLAEPFAVSHISGANVFLGGHTVSATGVGSAYVYCGKTQTSTEYKATVVGIGRWK